MSVAADMRRQGVGRLILGQLIEHAKAGPYRQVILETTATWLQVIEFYQRCGFRITHYRDGDAYFVLDLADVRCNDGRRDSAGTGDEIVERS